mgnify:CR=1 FL=1
MRLLIGLFVLLQVSPAMAIGAEQCALRGKLGDGAGLLANISVTPPAYGLAGSVQYGYCEMDDGFGQLQCAATANEKTTITYILDQENMDEQAYNCVTGCSADVVKKFVMVCEG